MNPNSSSPNQPRERQQRMTQYRILDGQHGGLVVSTFAHPSDWQARSQVIWNMQHTNVPAQVYALTFNPNGVEAFEFFAMQAFYWIEGDLTGVQIGQNSHGLVRMPPRPAPDALANLVIPAFRSDRQNLRVTGVQPMQNLSQIFNDPPPQQGESLMARVEYQERGRAIEEEFYGVYDRVPATNGALNWGFPRLFSFRSERGQLNSMRQTFWEIAASLQPNPVWRQLYEQTMQQLMSGVIDRDGIIRGILDKQIQENEEARRERERVRNEQNIKVAESAAWGRRNHEGAQDHHTRQEQVGDLLVDQTRFDNPNSDVGNPHVMQGHAQYVWTDNRGNYHYTNDPMDNPNHYKGGHWVLATRV
jgi:hypothetical protein